MRTNRIRRYIRHGTLPQLSVFEAAARLGSYTRAAEALHLSQPAVSVQLRKLSDAVGLPLFEQAGNRVRLTAAGRELHAACLDIFDRLDRAEARLTDIRGLESGELRLAVSTTAKYFAPRLLGTFVQRYPGIEVLLQIHPHEAQIERMNRNEDDLYIFTIPPGGGRFATRAILSNPMVACAADGHPLSTIRRVPFARFAQEPFLMREPGSGTRLVAQEAFALQGLQPRTRMELSSNEAIQQAILAGLGVSILPRRTLGAGAEPGGLCVLDVEGLPVECTWQFVHPADRRPGLAARAFMDFACSEAVAIAADPPSDYGQEAVDEHHHHCARRCTSASVRRKR